MKKTSQKILLAIKAKIDELNCPVPCWDFGYWKGYCKAIEEINNYPEGELYKQVYKAANQLCDNIRNNSKNPLTHFISFK